MARKTTAEKLMRTPLQRAATAKQQQDAAAAQGAAAPATYEDYVRQQMQARTGTAAPAQQQQANHFALTEDAIRMSQALLDSVKKVHPTTYTPYAGGGVRGMGLDLYNASAPATQRAMQGMSMQGYMPTNEQLKQLLSGEAYKPDISGWEYLTNYGAARRSIEHGVRDSRTLLDAASAGGMFDVRGNLVKDNIDLVSSGYLGENIETADYSMSKRADEAAQTNEEYLEYLKGMAGKVSMSEHNRAWASESPEAQGYKIDGVANFPFGAGWASNLAKQVYDTYEQNEKDYDEAAEMDGQPGIRLAYLDTVAEAETGAGWENIGMHNVMLANVLALNHVMSGGDLATYNEAEAMQWYESLTPEEQNALLSNDLQANVSGANYVMLANILALNHVMSGGDLQTYNELEAMQWYDNLSLEEQDDLLEWGIACFAGREPGYENVRWGNQDRGLNNPLNELGYNTQGFDLLKLRHTTDAEERQQNAEDASYIMHQEQEDRAAMEALDKSIDEEILSSGFSITPQQEAEIRAAISNEYRGWYSRTNYGNLMTSAEVIRYAYLLQKDEEEAAEYFEMLQDRELMRARGMVNTAETELLATDPVTAAPAFVASVGAGIVDAATLPVKAYEAWTGTDNPNNPINDLANFKAGVRQFQGAEINEAVGGGLGDIFEAGYNAGAAAADFYASYGVTKGLGALAGMGVAGTSNLTMGLMGAQSASATLTQYADDDMPGPAKTTFAMAVGMLEGLTEKIGLDALLSNPGSLWGYLRNNILSETMEEGITAAGTNLLDVAFSALTDTNSEVRETYYDYAAQRMENAYAAAIMDSLVEIMKEAAMGGATGGIIAAPTMVSTAVNDVRTGARIKEGGNSLPLIQMGAQMAEGSESQTLADEMMRKYKAFYDQQQAQAAAGEAETQAKVETPRAQVEEIQAAARESVAEQTAETAQAKVETPRAQVEEIQAAARESEAEQVAETAQAKVETPRAQVEEIQAEARESEPVQAAEVKQAQVETPRAQVEEIQTAARESEAEKAAPVEEKQPKAKQPKAKQPKAKQPKGKRPKEASSIKIGRLYRTMMAEAQSQNQSELTQRGVKAVEAAIGEKYQKLQLPESERYKPHAIARAIVDFGNDGQIKAYQQRNGEVVYDLTPEAKKTKVGRFIATHRVTMEIVNEYGSGNAEWAVDLSFDNMVYKTRGAEQVEKLQALLPPTKREKARQDAEEKRRQERAEAEKQGVQTMEDVEADTRDEVDALTGRVNAKEAVSNKITYKKGDRPQVVGELVRVEKNAGGEIQAVVRTPEGDTEVSMDELVQVGGTGVARVLVYAKHHGEMTTEEINALVGLTEKTAEQKVTSSQVIAAYEAGVRAGYAGEDKPALETVARTPYGDKAVQALETAMEMGHGMGKRQAAADEKNRTEGIGTRARGEGGVTFMGDVENTSDVTDTGVREDVETIMQDLTPQQNAAVRVLKTMSEASGIGITLFRTKVAEGEEIQTPNGFYDPNTNSIFIDLQAGASRGGEAMVESAILKTASHELTHYIEQNTQGEYAELRDEAKKLLNERGKSYAKLIDEKLRNLSNVDTRAQAEAEVIAEACEMMLKDSAAAEMMAKNNPGLWQKMTDWLKDFVAGFSRWVKRAFSGITATSEEAQALTEIRDGVERYVGDLQRIWDNALVEAAGKTAESKVETPRAQVEEIRAAARESEDVETDTGDAEEAEKYSERRQTDTEAFRKWFGNSVVRNEDGTPKVVYHQTAADFTVFNTNNPVAGLNDSETPNGIFFKDNDHDIGLGGGKQMAVYIRIDKPLHFKNREEANAWYRKNVDGYDALHRKLDEALAAFEPEFKAIEEEQFDPATSDERVDELFKIEDELIKKMGQVETEYRAQLRELLNQHFLKGGSGYDGIELDYDGHRWVNGVRENVHTYIVFSPTQIKSATDNVGTFDPANQDIRYSERRRITSDEAYNHMQEARKAWQEADREYTAAIRSMENDSDYEKLFAEDLATKDLNTLAMHLEEKYDVREKKRRRGEMEKALKAARQRYEEVRAAEEEDRLEELIKKSGLATEEYRVKEAKRIFGTTPYFYDAGYMLQDGTLLNFSGEKGRHDGSRNEDHRAIGQVYANVNGSKAMLTFMHEGNIRVIAETPGLDIASSVEPTTKQYTKIKQFVREHAEREYMSIDFTDNDGRTVGALEYEGSRITADRVVNDIQHFYETGELRKQGVSAYLYSQRRGKPDLSVREALMAITDFTGMTPAEQSLLNRYQSNVLRLQEVTEAIAAQTAIRDNKETPEKERTEAKKEIWRLRRQMFAIERALIDAENEGGYAKLMTTAGEMVRLLTTKDSLPEVTQALQEQIAKVTEQLAAVQQELGEKSEEDMWNTIRSLFDQRKLRAAAKKLKERYGSRIGEKTMMNRIVLMQTTLLRGGENATAEYMRLGEELVRELRSKSEQENDMLATLKEYIGTISLTDTQRQEINSQIGMKEFMSAVRPVVKVVPKGKGSVTLDVLLDEANAAEGGANPLLPYFEGHMSEGDSILHLYNLVKSAKAADVFVERYGQEQLQEEMIDVMGIAAEAALVDAGAETVKTVMEALAKNAEGSDALTAKVRQLRVEMTKAGRAAYAAAWKADERHKAMGDVIEYLTHLEEQEKLLADLDTKRKIERQVADESNKRIKEIIAERKVMDRNRVMRDRIRRTVGWMVTRIRRETDRKNVPEELKPYIEDAIRIFAEYNDVLRVFKKTEVAEIQKYFDALKKYDTKTEGKLNDLIAEELGDAFKTLRVYLEEYGEAKTKGHKKKTMLRNQSLKAIDEIVEILWGQISKWNEIFIGGKQAQLSDVAERTVAGLNTKGDYAIRDNVGGRFWAKVVEAARNKNLTPIYFFNMLEGNDVMQTMNDDVVKGQREYGVQLAAAKKKLEGIQTKYNYWAWKNADPLEFTTEQGRRTKDGKHDLSMTVDEAMSVWAIWKREQDTTPLFESTHISNGGIVLKAGKRRVNGKLVQDSTPHKLSEADMSVIDKWLTAEQKAYAEAIVEYMSKDMAEVGNRASMRMYGIKKFKEAHYFPMSVQRDQLAQSSNKAAKNPEANRIAGMSSAHRRVERAWKPLAISSFTEVAANHINDMLLYGNFAVPIENFNTILNYNYTKDPSGLNTVYEDASSMTVRALFRQKYGDSLTSYLETYLADLNGGTGVREHSKLMSLYKRSSVLASVAVWLQQPISIIRAWYVQNPKYYLMALSGKTAAPERKEWEQLCKYSGAAVLKSIGGFDMTSTRTMGGYLAGTAEDTYSLAKKAGALVGVNAEGERLAGAKRQADELLGLGAQKADQMAWTYMWMATKAEVAEKNPRMDTRSEEFLRLAADRFEEVVNLTQVYDSTLVRSQNMRSKSVFAKMATSFMAESTLTLNMLLDGYNRKDKKSIVKAAGIIILLQLATAAVKSLWTAARDDDEEKPWLEKYLAAVGGELGGYGGSLNPLNLIPYARDAMSLLEGYDVERADMALVDQLLNEATKWINGGYEDDPAKGAKNMSFALANMLGVPLKNIWRDVTTGINTWKDMTTDKRDVNVKVLRKEAMSNFLPWVDVSNDAYYTKLYEAMKKGDVKEVEALRVFLGTQGKDEDAVNAGVKGVVGELYLDKKLTEAEAKAFLLKNGLVKDDKAAFRAVDGWTEKAEHKGEKDYSYGVYDTLHESIANYDAKAVEAEIKQLTANGWTDKEVRQELRSHVYEEYRKGNITRSEAERILKQHGGYKAEEVSDPDFWYWTFREQDVKKTDPDEDFSRYDALYDALDKGSDAGVKAAVKELTAHGYTQQEAESKVYSRLIEQYRKGKMTWTQVQTLAKKHAGKGDLDANDWYWERRKQDWGKANGGSTDGYAKYADYYKAVETGVNIKTVTQEYLTHGIEAQELAANITKQYKEEYIRLYKTNKTAAANLQNRLLNAYTLLGYDRQKKIKDIAKWLE